MTGVVQVAWIVSGTTLAQFALNRVFAVMDRRELQKAVDKGNKETHAKLGEVDKKVDGVLTAAKSGELKAKGDLEHSLGKEEGVLQERARKDGGNDS